MSVPSRPLDTPAPKLSPIQELTQAVRAEATVIYSNYSYIRGEDRDVAEVDQPGFSDYASCA